jgi:hypothetical protein
LYVKRYVVRRGERRYVYLRLVEAYRDQAGKVRHRVVATLGREDALKASGQLDQLAASFARLDPPRAGIRREVGPLLVVAHYLERLGLRAIVDRAAPVRGRAMLTHGEVSCALVANRLCAPTPLYDIAGWAGQAAVHELLGAPAALLNDDRLGRCLDALAPVAEQVRGEALLGAIERCGAQAGRLHLDLTTLKVAGAYAGSELVGKGWAADRRVARQVRALQATTPAGVALYLRPDPGAAAELSLIGHALERLRELCPPGLCVVADSALGHERSLCQAARSGLRFIVPLRAATGFRERFLSEVGMQALRPLAHLAGRERDRPVARGTRYRGCLRPWPVTDPETGLTHAFRVAYIWSSEEAASVAQARERALQKAEGELVRVSRGRGGRHYQSVRQVADRLARIIGPAVAGLIETRIIERDGRPTIEWRRDEEAIAQRAATDGLYALCTNLPGRLSAARVLSRYKDQWVVERRHRDLKSTLRVRPVFLHNDERIAALVGVVGLALLIFGLIEADLRRRLGPDEPLALLPEGRSAPPTARGILAAFQGLGLTYTAEGIRLDRLTPTQRRILDLLEVPLPWPEQAAAA